MKLFDNISGLSIIGGGMAKLGPNKKAIEKARAAGDVKTEQAEILKACQIWSNHIVERMQVDIRVIHEENLPKHGPVVFIANPMAAFSSSRPENFCSFRRKSSSSIRHPAIYTLTVAPELPRALLENPIP